MPDWVASRRATIPDRTALIVAGTAFSYLDLDEEINRTARRLASLGVRAGDRVATLLHNGVAPAVLPHATLRLGAVIAPVNVRLSAEEIAWQLDDMAARLIITSGNGLELPGDFRTSHPTLTVVTTGAHAEAPHGAIPLDSVDEADCPLRLTHPSDAVLAIIYTSGTAGRPKGAMLTVGNFWWNAVGSALNLGTRADDRWLICLPLFHVGGLSIVMRAAIYGICAEIHEGFDAGAVNAAIDAGKVTMLSAVGVMLERMLDARGDIPYPSTLRCVLVGGGPVTESLLTRCSRLSLPVVPSYGLTETCSQVVAASPGDATRRPGAAGKPLYPNEVRLSTDSRRDWHPGDAGEILVRGPVVMAGYAGQPAGTRRAIVDGWLHTGDVGRIDEDGYLHVLDRRDDLIVTGGENVYPAEVESALLTHPAVLEAAVVGMSDPTWGQRVVAVTRLRETGDAAGSVDASVLSAHCRSRLATYKTPRDFHFVKQPLPRTASGKIRRSAVRELLLERGATSPGTPRAGR